MIGQSDTIKFFLNRLHYKVMDEVKCKSPWLLSPMRDLLEHERIGHTCREHVGKSIEQMRVRMVYESKTEVSSFWSVDAAKASVCFLTMNNLGSIIQWVMGSTINARETFEGYVPVRSYIGYAVTVHDDGVLFCNKAKMVLRKLPSTTDIFGIVTAFPVL